MSNRVKIYITGACALLAALVLVLCILGGVFDFENKSSSGSISGAATTPEPVITPPPIETPDAMRTPPPVEDVIPEIEIFSITVIAGKGGSVSPRGNVEVSEGEAVSFTLTPDEGYEVMQVLVNGVDEGPCEVYTFTDVRENHSIYVVFALAQTVPDTPGDEEPPTTPEPPGEETPQPEPEVPENNTTGE